MKLTEEQEIKIILTEVVRESIHRSLIALEKAGALNLDKLRKGYKSEQDKYYNLVNEEIKYTVDFAPNNIEEIGNTIVWIMSDAFNRSMSVLESKRAINRKELSKEYRGVGSKYYDIVTIEMESCIHKWVRLIEQYQGSGNAAHLANETRI